MSGIPEQVRVVVGEVLWVPAADLDDTRRLVEYGLDSPTAIEMTVQLEDTFGIRIPDQDAAGLQTVAQITAYVTQALT